MPTEDERPTNQPKRAGPWAFLSNRAGLIILVVLAAIVAVRLMSSWIKWMLIAVVIAAVVYLVKGVLRRSSDGTKRES
jgi:O-antigen ligase